MYRVYKYKNKIQETEVMRWAKSVIFLWYLTELLSSDIQWKQLLKTKKTQMSRPTVTHVQFGTTGKHLHQHSWSIHLHWMAGGKHWVCRFIISNKTASSQMHLLYLVATTCSESMLASSADWTVWFCWILRGLQWKVSHHLLIKASCNSGLHKVRMNWACNASLTITGIVQLAGYITEAVSGRQRAKSQGELLQEAVFTGWRAYYWRPGRYWV